MWPFSKPVLTDNTAFIFVTPEGDVNYPLIYPNNAEYTAGLEKIKEILRVWILQDIAFASQKGLRVEDTLIYQIMQIDLKFLGWEHQLNVLLRCIEDKGESYSGSRLMDTFLRIYIAVETDIIEVIKGRFLYGMIYGLQDQVNGQDLPNKQQWLKAILTYPWIPFLIFLQELYDEDDIVAKVTQLQGNGFSQATTTVLNNRPLGGAPA